MPEAERSARHLPYPHQGAPYCHSGQVGEQCGCIGISQWELVLGGKSLLGMLSYPLESGNAVSKLKRITRKFRCTLCDEDGEQPSQEIEQN